MSVPMLRLDAHTRRRLLTALRYAIDYEETFIDAHRTKLKRSKGVIVNVIDADYLPTVNRSRRRIAGWKAAMEKIMRVSTEKGG